MGWLILLLAASCTTWDTQATIPAHNTLEVNDPAAIAGNDINLSWQTETVANVAVEVWGFASDGTPQIQQIASFTNLPTVGTRTMPMPGTPSAVYLIVDSSVNRDQPPNITLQLVPTFYQPTVKRLQVSAAAAHPGGSLLVEWETDSIFPLSIKTSFVFATQDRSWTVPDQQFDQLSPSGNLTVTVPSGESDLSRLSFELSYRNQDYTGYLNQVLVDIMQN